VSSKGSWDETSESKIVPHPPSKKNAIDGCMCVCVCEGLCVYACMFINIYIYIYIYVCVCVYGCG